MRDRDRDHDADPERLDGETMVRVSVAKRQWERTFDAIADPLMIIDGAYTIRRANVALADELGIAVQRVVGRRCHEVRAESARRFVGAGPSPCAGCPVAGVQHEGVAADGEVRSDEGRTFTLRAFPVADEEAPLWVCHYHDVTEERALARDLASTERLASIGRLAGGVAHEINNPLGGILAFAQILQRDDASADERKEYLADIERSALRCKAIVEALMRFSRQAPRAERRAISLNDVVRDGARALASREPRPAPQVELELAEGLPPVLGDAGQLQQVVVSLLANALDGGGADRDVRVATAASGGDVNLRVVDRGSAIDDDDVQRLFDPFFDPRTPGRQPGLALAVAYAIVQEHGGRIVAQNRAGGGAEFVVTLPAAGEERAA